MQQVQVKEWKKNIEESMKISLPDQIASLYLKETDATKMELLIEVSYQGAYGMGEKFDSINQIGNEVVNEVVEKFCNQGNISYCTVPFFFLDAGLGIYIETKEKTIFKFHKTITCQIPEDALLYLFTGSAMEIISDFNKLLGKIITPPKFTFGPWISANHWNSQEKVKNVVQDIEKYQFPVTVLVLEAWSDEATFYIFNGAKYQEKNNGEAFQYEDFDFSESTYWKNPKEVMQELKKKGIYTILWQIPVYKEMEKGQSNLQNQLDHDDAVRRKLCVFTKDGEPYQIPEGNWFEGSIIPDFTNEKTIKTWFDKRKYLLDIGVAGFKTDGGEFIYREDVCFFDGTTGREGKNQYCQDYIGAYCKFGGAEHVLFSRAGFTGIQNTSCLWAGDHQSTNEELVNVYRAAISAACSGISYWSFDIGGFAGELPDMDLYLRATEFACFTPIMQWHSEPDGGQFKELMPGMEGNNERSPWNIAFVNHKETFLDEIRYWHILRMNLLPYIYSEALKSAEQCIPMMRPLFFKKNIASEESDLYTNSEEYYFGDSLLVAPLLEKNQTQRNVYLPQGDWYGLFSGKHYCGGQYSDSRKEKFPVFIQSGKAVVLQVPLEQLDEKKEEPGNEVMNLSHYCILMAGEEGTYEFVDESIKQIIEWHNGKITKSILKGRDCSFFFLI